MGALQFLGEELAKEGNPQFADPFPQELKRTYLIIIDGLIWIQYYS